MPRYRALITTAYGNKAGARFYRTIDGKLKWTNTYLGKEHIKFSFDWRRGRDNWIKEVRGAKDKTGGNENNLEEDHSPGGFQLIITP